MKVRFLMSHEGYERGDVLELLDADAEALKYDGVVEYADAAEEAETAEEAEGVE